MNLQNRIEVMVKLGEYIRSKPEEWNHTIKNASLHNAWFTEDFIHLAAQNITDCFLSEDLLKAKADTGRFPPGQICRGQGVHGWLPPRPSRPPHS